MTIIGPCIDKEDRRFYIVPPVYCGEVSEWLKEAVLKTVEPRGSVGSNPTFSGDISAITVKVGLKIRVKKMTA